MHPSLFRRLSCRRLIAVLAATVALIAALTQSMSARAVSTPPTPGNVVATPTGPYSFHVTWNNVSGASFVVDNGNEARSVPQGTTSYDWTVSSQGTYMCFTVAAKNSAGQSPWSPYSCTTSSVNTPVGMTATADASGVVVHLSWTNAADTGASFLVTNGNENRTVPAGTRTYDWRVSLDSYTCFAVAAQEGNGYSGWTPYSCVTTSSGDANRDSLITALQNVPANLTVGSKDTKGNTMDTAKIIKVGSGYYAIYSPGSHNIYLAASAAPQGPWTPIAVLDDPNASQPTLAQMSDGSFVLAEEYGQGQSSIKFRHYPTFQALALAQSDKDYVTSRLLSSCNEGTPDIHSTDVNSIAVGLHWDSACPPLGNRRDLEGFGTLTGLLSGNPSWTATDDSVRNSSMDNAVTPWVNPSGFPGKHGGRDDIPWSGRRYSLTEGQNQPTSENFATWRLGLYDYSNHQTYPVVLAGAFKAPCAANPRVTSTTDPAGKPILIVSAFIPSECGNAVGQAGELVYVIPAP